MNTLQIKRLSHDLTNIVAALTTVSTRLGLTIDERLLVILNDTLSKLKKINAEIDSIVAEPSRGFS
jgi:hypothetical protein